MLRSFVSVCLYHRLFQFDKIFNYERKKLQSFCKILRHVNPGTVGDSGGVWGGVRGRSELASYVEMAQTGEIPLDTFITHTMGLGDINKAFDLMHEGKSIRTVIHF